MNTHLKLLLSLLLIAPLFTAACGDPPKKDTSPSKCPANGASSSTCGGTHGQPHKKQIIPPGKCAVKEALPSTCDSLYDILLTTAKTPEQYLKGVFLPTDKKNATIATAQPTCVSDICKSTFTLGKGGIGGIYIDFDTNKVLDINDKDAYNTNTEWDVGFKHWVIISNGGNFPGNIAVAVAKGDKSKFESFSLDDAKKLSYTTEKLVDVDNKCKYIPVKSGGSFPTTELGVQSNELTRDLTSDEVVAPWVIPGSFYTYQFNGHYPQVPRDLFLVLKDCSKPNWYAKLWINNITPYDAHDMQVYTVTYQLLK